jgi:uncharacterized cupredoxin-like copper-binding protein
LTDPSQNRGTDPGRSKPPTPRWVKVFGIIGLVLLVLVVLMLTGVLGKGHGPGRHLGGGMTHGSTADVGGPAGAGLAGRTVEIVALDAPAFEPSTTQVSPGETVTFAVTNSGTTAHEFTLGDQEMQQDHAGMMAHIPAGMGHDTPNSITLQPGETKRLTWRFGDAGTLEYACHVQGHYGAGMRGRITII